jgi:hypothetical protein
MTTKHQLEFADETEGAIDALTSIAEGRGWCNLTPEVSADDVGVLTPSVFSLRTKQGAPVASFVTSPPKRGEPRPSSLGVLHTRGRLGAARIADLLAGASFAVRQDHTQRGLLLEVPADTAPPAILEAMRRLLTGLSDFEPTGRWRMDVFERA